MTRIVPDQFFVGLLINNTPDFNQSLNFLFHVLEAVGSRI